MRVAAPQLSAFGFGIKPPACISLICQGPIIPLDFPSSGALEENVCYGDAIAERLAAIQHEQIPENFAERLGKLEEQQTSAQENINQISLDYEVKLARIEDGKSQVETFKNTILENFGERLAKIEAQQSSVQETLKKIPEDLEKLEKNQKDMLTKMETQHSKLMETVSEIYNKVFFPKFQRIGSRLFHIDGDSKQNWVEAGKKCRQLGGYIAAIKDQEELDALKVKLEGNRYWLGINNRDNHEVFVSEASGRKNPFLKWRLKEPNNAKKNEYCVEYNNGGMNDDPCSKDRSLICQSDNEV
ncbi:accessory gland protein Acp29AB-like [Drosophila biarmipes]|uniref:accessory gland protein Acp29AB-like n=1 Tax=Drosophila biarmipes TaxID=125945 RepID=UPI0007E75810|nr:accessory gland protein Acp29AB-like [Drosophila biarmipes]